MIPDSYDLKIWLLLVLKKFAGKPLLITDLFTLFADVVADQEQIETVFDAACEKGEIEYASSQAHITSKGMHAVENHTLKELPQPIFFRLSALRLAAPAGEPTSETLAFLQEAAALATATLDNYIERVADPHILTLLREQQNLANETLADYLGANK